MEDQVLIAAVSLESVKSMKRHGGPRSRVKHDGYIVIKVGQFSAGRGADIDDIV